MKMYDILYENPHEDLVTRLLKARWLDYDNSDNHKFLHPTWKDHWIDPFKLNDLEKGIDRIILAIKNKEKIMIFGDYDVDGVTSCFILYDFFNKFLWYKNISVQLPNRLEDGYGMKNYHLDEMKSKWVDLVITVDNGITSVQEALYAKQIGLDLIITDHHKNLDIIPDAIAVINPQISPDYDFKGICGAWVAFKFVVGLSKKLKLNENIRRKIFNRYLPIVAVWTVSDCVPLICENRVMVKKWLDLINKKHSDVPISLLSMIEYYNIKSDIDSYHIWFMIWPRINAAGRVRSPYEALKSLIYTGEKQKHHLEEIDNLNTQRKKIQDNMVKMVENDITIDSNIIISCHEEYHEWVVGIVAGRVTEKYKLPSMILKIDHARWHGVASLRWPEYFSVIDMLYSAQDLLERYGWHKQAGWLTVKLEKLDQLISHFEDYCKNNIAPEMLTKPKKVDTVLYAHEINKDNLIQLDLLKPYGEGNPKPSLLLPGIVIKHKQLIGKDSSWKHLKLYWNYDDRVIEIVSRGWWKDIWDYDIWNRYDLSLEARVEADQGIYFML